MTSLRDFKSYTDIEHVRQRSDMYIGNIKCCTEPRWIIQKTDTGDSKAVHMEIESNPGLEQCVLEIFTNAADHVQRCRTLIESESSALDDYGNKICQVSKIKISLEKDHITVFNNGTGIPIEIKEIKGDDGKLSKMYVPELIFGYLRTSSNYDDTQKKTWGGRNGIGAKAANIFSTKFIIELHTNDKKYYQEFTDGMKNKTVPKITKMTSKGDYTKITYYPDFESFGMKDFESNDTGILIRKRAYDLSAATNKDTSVWLNEEKIPIKDFTDYMSLFIGNTKKVVYKTDRWEVGFALCPYDQATQISFVNAICTEEGGTHVLHVLDPVLTKITNELQNKIKGVTIKKQYIKDNIIIFIKSFIENPSFSSQLKRKLETKISDFGSRCDIPDDIIKKVSKLGICDNVMDIAKAKEMKDAMKKIDGTKNVRLSDIEKLEDANWAGTKKSMECTLILTEGDSAKGLALNGITSAGGSNKWGVFPLRGKFLNVRSATAAQLIKNEEIIAINRIMGLKIGITDTKKLRYGKIMIMSDQDSVTGDTPLVLKNSNGLVIIKNIEDLTDDFENKGGFIKEYGNTELKTWTDKGWTKIKYVMRHRTSKKIYRVLTNTGCVDVTEDHSLLTEKGEKIKPSECKIGQELLHSFPSFPDFSNFPSLCKTENLFEAYLMGVYFVDGICEIQDIDNVYKSLLYYKNYKYIPPCILNSSAKVRENFFKGYCDALKLDVSKQVVVREYSKITAHCIFTLCKSLGYQVTLYNELDVYTIYIHIHASGVSSAPLKFSKIIKITELPCIERYVYDLETENHHFNAGVGQMTISNTDGYHIKGLLINYFTFNWPDLVGKGLLECMMTPIVKIFKGNQTLKQFYNLDDYHKWMENNDSSKLRTKYYKGLGTSSASEAKEYFADLVSNRIGYNFNVDRDLSIIARSFEKDQADQRKDWIKEALRDKKEIDYNIKNVSIDYFINRELVQFSIYDNIRSIPSIIDGLKPSQRKILFACLKKKLFLKSDGEGEIKVSQLSGYIAEQTEYHHGEDSLQGTIIGMAQEFVGTGNMNLLIPSGNFGTRVNGKAAAARYIFTALRPEVKILFNETDNQLLNYLIEDGETIEPDFYVPIVPMLLLNGSTGIGTGWSTDIPCFKLEDIIYNIRLLMENEDAVLKDMIPYYKGFRGHIIKESDNCWKSVGTVEYIDQFRVEITELPVGMWKDTFRKYLDKLLDNGAIKSVTVNDDDKEKNANDVCYIVEFENEIEDEIDHLVDFFKLEKNINGTNMVAFDENKEIQKYASVEDIIWTFYKYRLNFYNKRHTFLKKTLEQQIHKISEKLRFVILVIDDKIVVFKKTKIQIGAELTTHRFEEQDQIQLLSMPLYKFTKEEVDALKKELKNLKEELVILNSKTEKDLWEEDLKNLEKLSN